MAEEEKEKPAPRKRASKKSAKPKLLTRDENGLVVGVDYKFDEDGYIDWRAMVDPTELYPNRDWFLARQQVVPETVEGLSDEQCLIKLGGIKKLLRLRGYSKVKTTTKVESAGYVSASCKIVFCGNYETDGNPVVYTDNANATLNNTDDFGAKFLEAIASNRAFVRCVRNFLNVNICGADEVDKSRKDNSQSTQSSQANAGLSPNVVLEKVAIESGLQTWEDFKEKLRELWSKSVYRNDGIKTWNGYNDIPAKEARVLTGILKSS